MNTSEISRETTIVIRAQQIVNRWRKLRSQHPFEQFLNRALLGSDDPFMEQDHHRLAIRRVAHAIWRGAGQAFSNREPLLKIARDTIKDP
jgi:hypothetical protein